MMRDAISSVKMISLIECTIPYGVSNVARGNTERSLDIRHLQPGGKYMYDVICVAYNWSRSVQRDA